MADKNNSSVVPVADVLKAFDTVNGGVHPGFRPAHAKGILLSGVFTPSPGGASLTRAPHLHRPSTPVSVRFSDFAGVPAVPDNDPNASPRGMAIRFHLTADTQTDIVAHSVDGFPGRTVGELVEFLQAAAASGPGAAKPSPIETYLGTHPAALHFVQAPKPFPTSFVRESFFGVNAFKFTNQAGAIQFARYRIKPDGAGEYLDDAAAAAKSTNFLMDEIKERLAKGPAKMRIFAQLAAPGDIVDDSFAHWPEDRPQIEFGTIELTTVVANNAAAQSALVFDPVPHVDGIDSSEDPLLEARSSAYITSFRRRHATTAT
jgi:catalase